MHPERNDAEHQLNLLRIPLNGLLVELVVAFLITLLLIPLVLIGSGPVRVVVGFAYVLVLPGYVALWALFPRKQDLEMIPRLALSMPVSIALVSFQGLVLNYTPWGISQNSILFSTVASMVLLLVLAWRKRRPYLLGRRSGQGLSRQVLTRIIRGRRKSEIVLTLLTTMAVVSALVASAYVLVRPGPGQEFTEFFVLGVEGYPDELTVEQESEIFVGVVNNEYQAADYTIQIVIDDERVGSTGRIRLSHLERWEQEITFAPVEPGLNQRVSFLLFKDNEPKPYRVLHIWINVS